MNIFSCIKIRQKSKKVTFCNTKNKRGSTLGVYRAFSSNHTKIPYSLNVYRNSRGSIGIKFSIESIGSGACISDKSVFTYRFETKTCFISICDITLKEIIN